MASVRTVSRMKWALLLGGAVLTPQAAWGQEATATADVEAEENVIVELDLWYRDDDDLHDESLDTLNEMLDEVVAAVKTV